MDKDTKIYIGLGVIVLVIIIGILLIKNQNNPTDMSLETMKCIASRSIMYSQTGCSHCRDQKAILGNYTNLFNITECDIDNHAKLCVDAGISGTPTWVIANKRYEGVQSIDKLKNYTGC